MSKGKLETLDVMNGDSNNVAPVIGDYLESVTEVLPIFTVHSGKPQEVLESFQKYINN